MKRFLLISALIFVGILASANLCAQDDITNTVKNVNDELYAPEPENSLVWRKQGDVSNTLYAYDQIYKMMRQISGMEQVFPTGTSVNIFSKEGSRRMVTPLPGIYIYVIAKYADGTIAFDIRSPEGNHLKLLEGLYDDLNPNSDWWEPVTEVLAAGELKVGPKGTITMINETAGILKTRPDIAAKLLIPGTSISNIKALMALDANFAKCFSINVKYISYDKNDMHLSPEFVTRRREAHNVRSLVQGLLSHLELANQQYDKYYSNNRNNFQQKVSEIVKSFLGNMDDIVKMFPYVEKFRNDTRLADLRHGKILSKQELHQLLLDLDKIRSSNDIGPIIINSEDKTDDLL